MTDSSFLFDDCAAAVRAVRDLQREGVDPRAIDIHRWDAEFCVRVRSSLKPRLDSRLRELGGRRFERPEPPVTEHAPTGTTGAEHRSDPSGPPRWWRGRISFFRD